MNHPEKVTAKREEAESGKVKTRNAIFAMNHTMCASSFEEFTDMLKQFKPLGVEQSYFSISGAAMKANEMGDILFKSHKKLFDAAPKRTDFPEGKGFLEAVDEFLAGPGKVFGEEISITGGRKK